MALRHHLHKTLPPSVISTSLNFHDPANQLKGQLLLRQLNVPEKSRVWWCPTSALCSLPLHALGPIPSDDSDRLYFMDLYVCSYAPTLSALIESRKPGSQPETLHKPSLRLVAQPESLHGAQGEINVVQAIGSPVTTLVSEKATPMIVVESVNHSTRRSNFTETISPYSRSFDLNFPPRNLHPFLLVTLASRPKTAFPTEDCTLRLQRNFVASGARSGRCGRWPIRTRQVFSESTGRRGVPYYERSARALQFAVKKLRKKRGITLERWANFVHYGA
ncbi:hypothetical protein EDB85DRAFT_1893574 [Lactarius pseudohatsudake]|nr:hypothetical protein EDB85DRAFT_1893574 [Lactarius pseudohatsudake]